jgi:CHAT domain-containing protein
MALRRSIRQGCPLSMLLYALYINPLLQHLTSILPGVKILAMGGTTSIVAYADDITIILTNPADVPLIQHALRHYMRASGAVLNTNKSKALALGTCDTSANILDIPYVAQMKVLGMQCTDNIEHSWTLNWVGLAGRTRAITQMAYSRDLCLTQRIWYTETFVLSLIWYMAQVIPPTTQTIRQINTAIMWYIWRGKIFRVPMATLYNTPEDGGLGLTHVQAKCIMLLVIQLWKQSGDRRSLTAAWLKKWNLLDTPQNPPTLQRSHRP